MHKWPWSTIIKETSNFECTLCARYGGEHFYLNLILPLQLYVANTAVPILQI